MNEKATSPIKTSVSKSLAADGSASSSYAERLVEATREAAERCNYDSPHWDGTKNVEGIYCQKCAKELFSDSVDGGFTTEHDISPLCENEKCSVPLDYTLTDYGVREELAYFEKEGIHSDNDAYCIHRLMNAGGFHLLTEGNNHPEWKGRIKAIYEVL